jgi:hypothetical protein
MASSTKVPVPENAGGDGTAPEPRGPGLQRTSTESLHISVELAKAHKAAIALVSKRNETAHHEAIKRRAASERHFAQLRADDQAARLQATDR